MQFELQSRAYSPIELDESLFTVKALERTAVAIVGATLITLVAAVVVWNLLVPAIFG